ncbi:DUF2206 domain-containing protein [Chloroflexota bacterium]
MAPPNDWRIGKCLVLSGSLLLATLGLIGLGAFGLDIPVLRQIVAFLFLGFVPGLLLLRILRIHNVHITESLLYSVGLSLIFNMVTGVIANFALPLLGIKHPFSLWPLAVTFTIFLIILFFAAYWRDRDFQPVSTDKVTETSIKPSLWARLNPYLLAILLPLLAILGASLVNAYYNNTLIFALTFVIVIIIGLAAFNKFIHPRVYPFMIFMMALALLYQTTFISDYLVGSDIHLEYYLANLVSENGYWDPTVPTTINSCLSVVMLAPVYSLFLNTEIVWLFKIVYPLLFALMPLALFRAFSLQIKSQYAFIAIVFFITLPMFTMDMVQLARQQISELFFVLVILLMVDRRLTLIRRTTLVLIFGFGIIVSYYGLGTGYVGYLFFGVLVLMIIKSRPGRFIWQRLIGKHNSLPPDLASPGAFNKRALVSVVVVSIIFMLVYYKFVASGTAMSGPQTASMIVSGTASGGFWLDPLTKEPLAQIALGLDFAWASIGGKVWRIFQYLIELCIIVGFFRLIFRPATLGPKLKAEYISLTIVSAFILLGVFILPTSSYGLGATRIWQITLLLMSPLFIFGGEAIAMGIVRLARVLRKNIASPGMNLTNQTLIWFPVIAILIPYFIFNSGAVFELSRSQTTHYIDTPYSVALSSHRLDLSTTFARQDVSAAEWLTERTSTNSRTYTDYQGSRIFINKDIISSNIIEMQSFITETGFLPDPDTVKELLRQARPKESITPYYFYLRKWNVQTGGLTFGGGYATRQKICFADFPWFAQATANADRIYDNGGAQILLVR